MGEFIKPWRRKFGVLTLMMACMFAAGWVRSLTLFDYITFPISGVGAGLLISQNGCFICTWSMSSNDEVAGWETTLLSSNFILRLNIAKGRES